MFLKKRQLSKTKILVGVLLLSSAYAFAQPEPGDRDHLDTIQGQHEIDEKIGKGLEYLVSKQDPVTGKFEGDLPNTYTALSCMALMAAGQIPGQSKYGDNLHRGIMYLTRKSKDHKGYYGNEGNARMYGHGICTLALCEAYGMLEKEEDNLKVKQSIEAAVKIILHAQSDKDKARGGWRYEPKPNDSDLSVTVWQILALRSAQNCQLDVPDKAIELAVDYVRRTYSAAQQGFSYQAPGNNASPGMRAAGVVALQALGARHEESDKKLMEQSASFLKTFDPSRASHYYYTAYYLATASNMMSDELRETFLPRLEKSLMKLQKENGEFHKHSGHQGGVYSTAFGIICLCVHYQYLPIYQE
jgi:prenyltransferase beta subunit